MAIDRPAVLEIAELAISLNVVAERRSTGLDGLGQNRSNSRDEPVGELPPQSWMEEEGTKAVIAALSADGAEPRFIGSRLLADRRPRRAILLRNRNVDENHDGFGDHTLHRRRCARAACA